MNEIQNNNDRGIRNAMKTEVYFRLHPANEIRITDLMIGVESRTPFIELSLS